MGTRMRVIVGMCLAVALTASSAAKLFYIFEDDEGRTRMFDSIPPEYAQKGYRVVNEAGATVEVVPPSRNRRVQRRLTDDERALLRTFDSVEDLQAARDRQVEALEAIIHSTQSTLEVIRGNLKNLSARATALEARGEPVSEKLLQDIQSANSQIETNELYVDKKRHEQSELRERYNQDIKRFRELKGRKAR